MKSIILSFIISLFSINSGNRIINESPKMIFKTQIDSSTEVSVENTYESIGCMSSWKVTISRDIESEGWIMELIGVPVRITTISCSTGGEFQCPTCVNDEVLQA